MTEPAITLELVAKHNLVPDEYAHAREIPGSMGGLLIFESMIAALPDKGMVNAA